MPYSQKYAAFTTQSPPEPTQERPTQPQSGGKRPYKPDWLVVLISVLVFITMLIAILFNIFGF